MELMHEKLIDFKSTTAKSIEPLASEHTAALNEIKEMMRNQMKEFQDLREREHASLATALRQKTDLMEELIKIREAQKASDEEIKVLKDENRTLKDTVAKGQEIRQQEQTSITTLSTLNQNLAHEILEVKVATIVSEAENKSLRAENREIKKMMEEENRQCQKLIERLTTKVEFAVTSLVGLHAEKRDESVDEDYGETDEMSDDLMEVLWPQGWEDEDTRKRCAIDGKVLQRGVLVNEPGARVPAGNVSRGGGGWCTVM
jgi:chromosome segregation ATPase